MKTEWIIMMVGALVFLSHYFNALFRKSKIPDILLLFGVGLLLGPVFNVVKPEQFGQLGRVFATVTLVFILFEGGMELRMDLLRKSIKGIFKLTFFNYLATVMVLTTIGYFFTDLGLLRSAIWANILGGTSSAVVTSLAQKLKIHPHTQTLLVMESAVSDVFTLVIPLALMDLWFVGEVDAAKTVGHMLSSFAMALVLGAGGGLLWSWMREKITGLSGAAFTTPAFVFILYGISESLGFSGPITALTFGIVLGNLSEFKFPLIQRIILNNEVELTEREKSFLSEIVFILRTFFFVYIGASIRFTDIHLMAIAAIGTILLFTIRIPVVHLTLPKNLPRRDAVITQFLIPKGLGAAVLASLPANLGIPMGQEIQMLTFGVIFYSTIFTTLLVFLYEKTPLKHVFNKAFPGYAESTNMDHPPA